MGTIKADTLTGLSTASEVTIVSNKFTSTAAGSITLPGENTATTNLQQGLLKAWADYQTSGSNAFNGSFNFSTITDVGTGDVRLNFTNNMNDTHYSGWAGGAAISLVYFDAQATGNQRMRAYSDLSTEADGSHRYGGVAGDLA